MHPETRLKLADVAPPPSPYTETENLIKKTKSKDLVIIISTVKSLLRFLPPPYRVFHVFSPW